MTYVGELGYEIYVRDRRQENMSRKCEYKINNNKKIQVPTESAQLLYDTLHDAGKTFELRDAGYYAIDSLRVEKAYRAWGHELSVLENPFEAGLSFTIDWDSNFVGKERLSLEKSKPLKQRLISLHTDNMSTPIWGGEPILLNGQVVGNVTSSNYAHSVGGQIALGYVKHDNVGEKGFVKRSEFCIDVGGNELSARGTLRPMFDPKNRRVQGIYSLD